MNLRPTSTLKKGRRKRGNGLYRGIRFRGDKWISEIRVPRTPKRIWLGSHLSAERAARAYDAALYCLKGEEGIFNFPSNRKPDLSGKPIGSLSEDEIRCIAQEFSTLGDSVETPALSRPRKVPQSVESDVIPISEMSNQFIVNKVDIPEESYIPTFAPEEVPSDPTFEPYIPTFAPEEVPSDPTFVPDGNFLAEQFMQLDIWFGSDEDWMKNSVHARL